MSAIALNRMIRGVLLAMVFALTPSGIASAAPPYRIMMVLWRGCEEACRGFQAYLGEKDVPVEFLLRNADQDPLILPKLVAEARSLKVDLVVTWGTTVTLGMVSEFDKVNPDVHLNDIPVVFMLVSDPLASRIVPNLESSGRNVAGTLYLISEETQLRAIRSYLNFQKVGMVYNTNEANAVQGAEKMKAIAERQGFSLITRTVPMDAGGRPIAAALPLLLGELAKEGVDLIYMGPSSFITINRDVFTNAALELGVPVASDAEDPIIDANALFGLVSRYYLVGKLTARLAKKILVDGKDPATMPIENLARFSLIVNMEVARKLELYPPMSLLDIADVIKADRPQH